MLNRYNGLYARVQIDVDCSMQLSERILVKRTGLNFFVRIEYEDMPEFCTLCSVIGHNRNSCRNSKTDHETRQETVEEEGRKRRKTKQREQGEAQKTGIQNLAQSHRGAYSHNGPVANLEKEQSLHDSMEEQMTNHINRSARLPQEHSGGEQSGDRHQKSMQPQDSMDEQVEGPPSQNRHVDNLHDRVHNSQQQQQRAFVAYSIITQGEGTIHGKNDMGSESSQNEIPQ